MAMAFPAGCIPPEGYFESREAMHLQLRGHRLNRPLCVVNAMQLAIR